MYERARTPAIVVLFCLPLPLLQRRVLPASLQKISDSRKINPNNERLIQCPYCLQKYLLVWDDREWNFVQECAFASKVDGAQTTGTVGR
jgi:hypothetical protein